MDISDREAEMNAQVVPNEDHIMNISSSDHASISSEQSELNQPQNEDEWGRISDSPSEHAYMVPWNSITSFSSVSCLLIRLAVVLSQTALSALIVLLAESDDIKPAMFVWVASYACICVVTIAILVLRLYHERGAGQYLGAHQTSSESNPLDSVSYTALPANQPPEDINEQNTWTSSLQLRGNISELLNGLIEHFDTIVNFLYGCWYIIGTIWFFDNSVTSQSAVTFGVLVLFVAIGCVMLSMPISLVAVLYICLIPLACILNPREFHGQNRGASSKAISSLTSFKFKIISCEVGDQEGTGTGKGGIFAIGTEKERIIAEEDAFCCICLAKYNDDDELKELPCVHVFHARCIDRWLSINAICPLCKKKVQIGRRGCCCCPIFSLFR